MGTRNNGNRRRISRKEQLVESGRRFGRVSRVVITLVAIIATAGGLPLLGYFGYRQVLESGYFSPKVMKVEGNSRVSQDEILSAAQLDSADINLIEWDIAAAESRIETLNWIESATIETELPDTVRIEVVERTALGVVLDEQLFLVDVNGEIIKPWTNDGMLESAIVSGIDIDGPHGRSRVRNGFEIIAMYQAMGLEKWGKLAEVHWDDRLGISLFTGDTEIRLGHDRYDERLRRLWQVYALLEERDARAEYVLLDMNENLDRVAIKPYPKIVSAPVPEPVIDGEGNEGETKQN